MYLCIICTLPSQCLFISPTVYAFVFSVFASLSAFLLYETNDGPVFQSVVMGGLFHNTATEIRGLVYAQFIVYKNESGVTLCMLSHKVLSS